MSAFLNRLLGYNKNNVKMNVLGTPTANNGDVIQVDLPTNSIVDLSSLAWSFQVAYTGAAGSVAPVNGAVTFPLNAESIISRLAVEVNGQTLVNLQNYNQLYHALLYMTATQDYQHQRRVAQSNIEGGTANGTTLNRASPGGAAVNPISAFVLAILTTGIRPYARCHELGRAASGVAASHHSERSHRRGARITHYPARPTLGQACAPPPSSPLSPSLPPSVPPTLPAEVCV